MNNFIISFIVLLLSQSIHALEIDARYEGSGRFEVSANGTSPLRAAKIISIISDLENQCIKGCTYYLPGIRETVIIQKISQHEFYTWTRAEDIMKEEYISKITVTENSVQYSTPNENNLNSLDTKKYKHKPIFIEREGKWTVTEIFDSVGDFSHCRLDFILKIYSKKRLVKIFNKQVIDKIKDELRFNFKFFQ